MGGFDSGGKHPKVLSVFSLVMINVIAVDSLRTLPIGAEYGFALVFFYLLAGLIFFVPVALVATELATTWPARGGLYVWVREAFGARWGFFTIWLQWIYNIVWYPTILAFIAAAIAYLFDPLMANHKPYLLGTAFVIFWSATLLNCLGMRVSSWVSTFGAVFGTLLPMIFITVLGFTWIWNDYPTEIQFTWGEFWPKLKGIGSVVLLTNLLFGLLGVEMSGVHAEAVKDPRRAYSKAILYSTVIIFTTLVLASLAIAIVIPPHKISLVSGLIDAFAIFFNAFNLPWMIPIIAVMIIIGGICGVSTWVIGPTKGLLVAAEDHALPRIFSHVNRFDAPMSLLILQAVIFTLLSTVFIFMEEINASYWMLSALTAQLAMIVYVLMFAAVIKLRYSQADKPRPFKIPGGIGMVWLIAGMGLLTCVASVLIGFVPPDQITIGNLGGYVSFLFIGIIVFSAIPFILLARQRKAESVE